MGKFSLLIAIAAMAVISVLMLVSRQASQSADVLLADHTFKNIGREASLAGLNLTTRRLVDDTTSWAADPAKYAFTDQPYQHAHFSTRVSGGYGSTVVLGRCVIDTVDVVSVGTARGGRTHEIHATYVRTCSNAGGLPPAFRFATASEKNFDVDGEVRVWAADEDQNASIHSNRKLSVTDKAYIEGYGTYVQNGGACSYCDDGEHFDPNNPFMGTPYVQQADPIEIPAFVPEDYLPRATHYETNLVDGVFYVNDNRTIDFTSYKGITGYGTKQNPAIWYIPGDLHINSDYLKVIGYVMIITVGYVHVNGDADILAELPPGVSPPQTSITNPNTEAVRDWFDQYVPDGTTLGLYAGGTSQGFTSTEITWWSARSSRTEISGSTETQPSSAPWLRAAACTTTEKTLFGIREPTKPPRCLAPPSCFPTAFG